MADATTPPANDTITNEYTSRRRLTASSGMSSSGYLSQYAIASPTLGRGHRTRLAFVDAAGHPLGPTLALGRQAPALGERLQVAEILWEEAIVVQTTTRSPW